MRLNLLAVLLLTACEASISLAQPPPPPPTAPGITNPAGAPSTLTGNISQFNYGRDGRAEGFVLSTNTLVMVPPDWGTQIETMVKTGDPVKVTGIATPGASGMQIMEAQSVSVAGLSFVEPSRPAPYAGSGAIRQLNYGRQGEVNGFVLANGIIASTPPFGDSDVSVIKPGAAISISGFARTTPAGKTIVDVQTVTVNGQTIALAGGPTAGPAPEPGPGRGGRGGRGGPAPPPPGR